MKTKVVNIIDLASPSAQAAIAEAGEILRQGGIVGFPTETVYGLGASSYDAQAVAKVFAAKGRPADNPLISHVNTVQEAEALGVFTPLAQKLAQAFWPGPFTLVLEKKDCGVPDVVTAGLSSIAIRCPVCPMTRALIAAAKVPIAAPSGNRSGRPSPTLARHMLEDLDGKIPLILDGGPVDIGLESTVVDARGELPVLLRPGRITREMLEEVAGGCLFPSVKAGERPASPGMKYRHYAPQGELRLVSDVRAMEAQRLLWLDQDPTPPLLLVTEESAASLKAQGVKAEEMICLGHKNDAAAFAHAIFAALREADSRGAKRILCESVPDTGLGLAIMNRLQKASSKA